MAHLWIELEELGVGVAVHLRRDDVTDAVTWLDYPQSGFGESGEKGGRVTGRQGWVGVWGSKHWGGRGGWRVD